MAFGALHELPAGEPALTRQLYVANTSGETLSVIDLARREVVREIRVGNHPHGLALSPDHRTCYCSIESERALKIIETAGGQIRSSIPLSGVPNQLAVSSDGNWAYIAINDQGTADVVDLKQGKVVKSLSIGKRPHNCYCPAGGRFMYVTSIGDHLVKQFDFRNGHRETMTVLFDGPVRPLCVTHDDKRLFVALEGLHGFGWADLEKGRQVGRIDQPLPPPEKRSKFAYMNTHGLELRPGDRELWVTSFIGNGLMIFDITRAEPQYVKTVAVGDGPNWLAFSPDGKYAYSANAGADSITIVDCDKRSALKEIKVGPVPKRLLEVAPH